MRTSFIPKSLLLGTALLLAANAFATEKATVLFSDRTTVGGTELKAGEYQVRWDGDGPAVELTILKDKAIIAKIPARRIDVKHPADGNTTTTKANPDGSRSISQIQISGKKYAFEIGKDPAQAETGSSTK